MVALPSLCLAAYGSGAVLTCRQLQKWLGQQRFKHSYPEGQAKSILNI